MNSPDPPTLNDVCEFIEDCLHATAPIQEDGYPLIRTPNIGKGRLTLDGVYRVSQDTYDKWTRRARPEPGDLILAREAPAGNVAVVREGEAVALGQRTVHLRPDSDQVDPEYLCYYLLTPKMQGALLAGETGATAKHVNMKDIRRLPLLDLHEREVQSKLGRMIGVYDDLIENNRRQIKLVEEAARLIYREWFVRLRFPGHEHTMIDSGVPEGWKRKSVGELSEFSIGGGWGQDEPTASYTIPGYVIRGTDIPDLAAGNFDRVPLRYHTESNFKSRNLRPGDIILEVSNGNIRNIGRTYRVEEGLLKKLGEKALCASFCKMIRPNSWHNSILLFAHLQEMQSSGTMDHFKTPSAAGINNFRFPALLAEAHVLIPGEPLLEDFIRQYEPLLAQQATLASTNGILTQARDLLLPRLMSGEIEV